MVRRYPLVMLLLATFAMAQAQTRARPADQPVLHLDLRTLGAVGLQVPVDEPSRPIYAGRVSFIDNSTLALSFPIFNPVTKLSTREHPNGGSILLHTVVLDMSTGRPKEQKSWGNAARTEIMAAGSRFLVLSGRTVQVISSDLQVEREYRYGWSSPFRLRTSETGNTLFLVARDEQNEVVEVLDAAGRYAPYTFRVPSDGSDSASDVDFAFSREQGKTSDIFRVPLAAVRQGTAELHPLPYRPEGACKDPFFIDDEQLILGGVCEQFIVVGADGTIKAQQQISNVTFFGLAGRIQIKERIYLNGFVVSRDKRRFAVVLRETQAQARKGEVPAAAYHARTLGVYDSSLATLLEVPVPQVEKATYALDQALSPDGSLVALLVGWDVFVYRVPGPKSEP